MVGATTRVGATIRPGHALELGCIVLGRDRVWLAVGQWLAA
jgi:hypothetical protein